MTRLPLILCALFAFATPAGAGGYTNLVSTTFYGEKKCNGGEELPIDQKNWTGHDVWIVGVSLSVHMIENDGKNAWAMPGIANGRGGDYLDGMIFGTGSRTVMYPPGFAFLLPGEQSDHHHVDVHANCNGGGWAVVRLTVFWHCPSCPPGAVYPPPPWPPPSND